MRGVARVLLLMVVGTAILLPIASAFPDGLARVALSRGIGEPAPIGAASCAATPQAWLTARTWTGLPLASWACFSCLEPPGS